MLLILPSSSFSSVTSFLFDLFQVLLFISVPLFPLIPLSLAHLFRRSHQHSPHPIHLLAFVFLILLLHIFLVLILISLRLILNYCAPPRVFPNLSSSSAHPHVSYHMPLLTPYLPDKENRDNTQNFAHKCQLEASELACVTLRGNMSSEIWWNSTGLHDLTSQRRVLRYSCCTRNLKSAHVKYIDLSKWKRPLYAVLCSFWVIIGAE